MKIVPKYTIGFDIEVDENTSFSYTELKIFFGYFSYYNLFDLIRDNGSLAIDSDEVLDNIKIFDYLVKQNILKATQLSYYFWVNDVDKLKEIIWDLEDCYNDLDKNYKIYEREFNIDSVID
tara:strand:+ start:2414 stop:2776 length:363 start_codon:yes stop_codon:yes gene_type:complete